MMLSSNLISWKYITLILAFCKHCIFFSHAFVYPLLFFRSFSYEHKGIKDENQAMNNLKCLVKTRPQFEIIGWGESRHKHLKCFSKCMEITSCHAQVFLSGTKCPKRVTRRSIEKGAFGLPSTMIGQFTIYICVCEHKSLKK